MKQYILDTPMTPPPRYAEGDEAARLLELANACREILVGGTITVEKANAVRRWIAASGWLRKFWPANVLAARINRVMDVRRKRDLDELNELLEAIVDEAGDVLGRWCDHRADLFDNPVPHIIHERRSFCFTGIFYFGARYDCEQVVRDRGGIIKSTVSGLTNYLIVGAICNPLWLHAQSGTKIEAAKYHRQYAMEWNANPKLTKKNVPEIIREHHWVESLNEFASTN